MTCDEMGWSQFFFDVFSGDVGKMSGISNCFDFYDQDRDLII